MGNSVPPPSNAVQVGDLRVRVRPEHALQERQRVLLALHHLTVPPLGFVAGPIQNVDGHAAIVESTLVHVVRRRRPGEMVYAPGQESHTLVSGRHLHTRCGRRRAVVIVPSGDTSPLQHTLPAGITLHHHRAGAEDLVVADDDGDIVGAELAVELSGGDERVVLPSAPVVDRHAGIPLREIVLAAAPPLPPWHGGRARVPCEVHAERVPRKQGTREGEPHDGTVRRARVLHTHRAAVHRHRRGEALVAVIRIFQVLETIAPLALIHRTPLRSGTERIEVLMEEHLAQRVGGVVHVHQVAPRVEHALLFVQAGGDGVVDVLLPVAGGITAGRRGGRRLLQKQKNGKQCDHDGSASDRR